MVRRANTEGGFSDRVTRALKDQGAFVRKFQATRFASGMPDLIVIVNGITAFVELKREGKELTPLQRQTMVSIAKHGGLAIQLRINQQQGCDLSFMHQDGDLRAMCTCTIQDIVVSLKMAYLCQTHNLG